jgi:hypothetical protein
MRLDGDIIESINTSRLAVFWMPPYPNLSSLKSTATLHKDSSQHQ